MSVSISNRIEEVDGDKSNISFNEDSIVDKFQSTDLPIPVSFEVENNDKEVTDEQVSKERITPDNQRKLKDDFLSANTAVLSPPNLMGSRTESALSQQGRGGMGLPLDFDNYDTNTMSPTATITPGNGNKDTNSKSKTMLEG